MEKSFQVSAVKDLNQINATIKHIYNQVALGNLAVPEIYDVFKRKIEKALGNLPGFEVICDSRTNSPSMLSQNRMGYQIIVGVEGNKYSLTEMDLRTTFRGGENE